MRRICSPPLMRERPEETFPSSSRRFTTREAWEREMLRNSAMPSWVISRGAPNSMVSGMWR